MADNRLYLVHDETGAEIVIAKRYATEWGCPYGMRASLDEFLANCFEASGLKGQDGFSLRIENPPAPPPIGQRGG